MQRDSGRATQRGEGEITVKEPCPAGRAACELANAAFALTTPPKAPCTSRNTRNCSGLSAFAPPPLQPLVDEIRFDLPVG